MASSARKEPPGFCVFLSCVPGGPAAHSKDTGAPSVPSSESPSTSVPTGGPRPLTFLSGLPWGTSQVHLGSVLTRAEGRLVRGAGTGPGLPGQAFQRAWSWGLAVAGRGRVSGWWITWKVGTEAPNGCFQGHHLLPLMQPGLMPRQAGREAAGARTVKSGRLILSIGEGSWAVTTRPPAGLSPYPQCPQGAWPLGALGQLQPFCSPCGWGAHLRAAPSPPQTGPGQLDRGDELPGLRAESPSPSGPAGRECHSRKCGPRRRRPARPPRPTFEEHPVGEGSPRGPTRAPESSQDPGTS